MRQLIHYIRHYARGITRLAFVTSLIFLFNNCGQMEGINTIGALNSASTGNSDPTSTPTPPSSPQIVTNLPIVSTELTNMRVLVNGSSATITFDTIDDAADYRVYALPANNNIQLNSDGSITIPNAIYRCAGTYQVPRVQVENEQIQSNGMTTRVTTAFAGYVRTLAEANLGYVYTTPFAAADLTPVYAVGSPDAHADDDYFYRYQASRDKKYTTSVSEYALLVASGGRDDGVVFYVPSQASAATKPVLSNTNIPDQMHGARYYLNQGNELMSRDANLGFATAFNVLIAPAPGARALMRVLYEPFAGRSHDELVVGQANFIRIRNQGFNNPATVLHYSGLTANTTLVVEALDKGCPFQSVIASRSVAAETFDFGTFNVPHPAWSTLADLRQNVLNGEIYVNGQHDGVNGKPKAIARSFINVAPQAREPMDWMSTAASFSEAFTESKCEVPDGNCFQQFHLSSNTYDISFFSTETRHWEVGNVLGEFLVTYADWAADTNGKFRMTPKNQKATIAANSFMHATMEVNSVTSGRRYPQLIVSDQDIPVQYNLIHGRSLILQSFGDFPSRIDLEVCDHKTWDVNDQCPRFIFRHKFNASGGIAGINPIPEEDQFMAAVDAKVKYDLYASNSRAYIFINNKPYACANLNNNSGVSPRPISPTGAVSVTFGDALYHSGADDNFLVKMPGSFINRHQQLYTSRHYDNLGFSSGLTAPAWDESKIPCSSTMTTLDYDPGL